MATIVGNNRNNNLRGTNRDDTIDGRGGRDAMTGRDGDDIYIVDNVGDTVIESVNQGQDLIRSSVSFTLSNHVEDLRLTGSANLNGFGNSMNNAITGNSGRNTLRGNNGDDVLDGRGGADRLIGGKGSDVYYVDNVGDTVEETGGDWDEVHSTVSFTLTDLIEALYFEGDDDLDGTGTASNDDIHGNSGNNVLRGLGGTDFLYGNGGIDVLEGGAGSDRLDAQDGEGGDTLIGGVGGDSYVIDEGDVVIEHAGEGSDSLSVNFSYTLTEDSALENLSTRSENSVTLIGNSQDNSMYSLGGGDILRGEGGNDRIYLDEGDELSHVFGGAGDDELLAETGFGGGILEGGTGDDRYWTFSGSSLVVEHAGEGIDTVHAWHGHWLRLADNVENLFLLEPFFDNSGTLEVGRGNDLDNRIINQIGDDYYVDLYGEGGNDYIEGHDGATHYTGGSGADRFLVTSRESAFSSREQTIRDFAHGEDEILLDNAQFAAIGSEGDLSADAFHSGMAAQTAAHRIIFDESDGALYYDPDGTGAQAQVFFLRLGDASTGGADASDFVVV
jgi:trimeric autotransporter adhesin